MSSTDRVCACGQTIPFTTTIDGKRHNLNSRKFCLTCSPFGMHNTRDITKPRPAPIEKFRLYQERVRRERKQALVEIRGGNCVTCGYSKCIAAMEFHHRDPADKKFQLSKANLLKRWPVVLAEAEKCDLYCSRCHRELEEEIRLSSS